MIADLAEQLADRGIYVKVERGTQRGSCPKCDRGPKDDALAVTIDEGGATTWWCHRCHHKGGIGRSNGARHHQKNGHEQVALRAAEILQAGHYVGGAHPYLKRKGVSTHGLKADDSNRLIIPMYGADGKLWNVQTIAHNGDKRFLRGGRVKGCFFMLGSGNSSAFDQIVIAEGFATAASIRQAVNTVPVAIAFNRGNLEPVARALRAACPEACIVIASDDDYATAGNPGLTDARAAAELIGAAVAVPEFPANGGSRGTDFNDLHVGHGLEAVSKIIHAALDSEPEPRQPPPEPEPRAPRILDLSDYGATRFAGPPPQIKWLVQHSIPLGVPVLVAAMGGVGKSYLILQLCYLVATPPIENPSKLDDQIHNLNTYTRPLLAGC
jgi:hypothetical protein